LVTKRTTRDATHHYYEAETPGFSYFAITGSSKVTPTEEVTEEVTTEETTDETTEDTTGEPEPESTPDSKEADSKLFMGQ